MKIQVEPLSHPTLQFSAVLPERFSGERLGGADILSAMGDFGSLCIQEFDGTNFLIRYSVLVIHEAFSVRIKSFFNGLYGVIVQRGQIEADIFGAGQFGMSEGQFSFIHASEPEVKMLFEPNQQYIFFEVILSDLFSIEIISEFKQLSPVFSKQSPEIWVNPAQYIDEEVKDYIRYVLNYDDQPEWRRNYYENQAWHIAWKLLALHAKVDLQISNVTEEERQKAHEVRQLIVDNLDKHLLVKELARKVKLSQSGLKKIFTKVFGMGIHEYRIEQRLKVAIELVNAGKLVKEAAAMTGWRSANLIKAYRKKYGTTPGTIKGKRR